MASFEGFTTEHLVGLPSELFMDVLPQISLPSELKVTLHVFWKLSRQRGPAPRRVSWDELDADRTLRRSLKSISKLRPPDELLAEGIEAAVRRATLLHVVLPSDGRSVNWYLVNTAANRGWVELAGRVGTVVQPADHISDDRPAILTLYEQNIGLITPMIIEELREAEERYPINWIEDAMREAVRANARSWRYIRKVLERWAANGRQTPTDHPERPIDVEKYTSGAYGDLFRRGSDTSDL